MNGQAEVLKIGRFEGQNEEWQSAIATGTIQEEPAIFQIPSREVDTLGKRFLGFFRLTKGTPKEHSYFDTGLERYGSFLNYLQWQPISGVVTISISSFEVPLDLINEYGSFRYWASYSSYSKSNIWRGVFAPSYRRRILFSQQMDIETSSLERWKPHITIDRRTIERVENE